MDTELPIYFTREEYRILLKCISHSNYVVSQEEQDTINRSIFDKLYHLTESCN